MKTFVYEEGTGEIVEKKSRFIAYIFPVKTEDEALEKIAMIKKKHYDARHNCFAYVIGNDNEIERSSDDGEPSGTAGRPMLEVLNGENITNVVAIVTRYFGGTLLGTGGLVRAYQSAMKAGLANCKLLTSYEAVLAVVLSDYNEVGKIQYIARSLEIDEAESEYSDRVKLVFYVKKDVLSSFEKEVTEKTAGKCSVETADEIVFGKIDGKVILL